MVTICSMQTISREDSNTEEGSGVYAPALGEGVCSCHAADAPPRPSPVFENPQRLYVIHVDSCVEGSESSICDKGNKQLEGRVLIPVSRLA